MVWIVVGAVVLVGLVAAWLVDRRWDVDPTLRRSQGHSQGHSQAASDQAWTATRDHSGGSL